jgi:hypothetical protein
MKMRWTTCRVCKQVVRVRKNGSVWYHLLPYFQDSVSKHCPNGAIYGVDLK